MRRIAIVIGAAALIAAGAPAARAGGGGCHEDQSSQGTGTKVTLKQLCFAPTVTHIQPGETVTWTNSDDLPHTITGMPGTFDSDELRLGETFKHTFPDAGTYAYYCVLHRRMAGAVVVAGETSKTSPRTGSGETGTGSTDTSRGSTDTTSLAGSKSSGSSSALPISALAIAIPAAAGLGFGAGRRRVVATPD
jgi:plastocyanin